MGWDKETAPRTEYGWCVEELDPATRGEGRDRDIVETSEWKSLEEARAAASELDPRDVDIGLVKHSFTLVDGETDRTYAYLEDGKLPAAFEDGSSIPAKYRKETE